MSPAAKSHHLQFFKHNNISLKRKGFFSSAVDTHTRCSPNSSLKLRTADSTRSAAQKSEAILHDFAKKVVELKTTTNYYAKLLPDREQIATLSPDFRNSLASAYPIPRHIAKIK